MIDDFRERAKSHFARILSYWKEIEQWIKIAEQISNKAVIPAINELRYASRQFFNAQMVFSDSVLSDEQKEDITKRLTVGEQYLLNADHDIIDGVMAFLREIVSGIDKEFGPTAITEVFVEYPLFKKSMKQCDELIADARFDYSKRKSNYSKIRLELFPEIRRQYEQLIAAEISARETKQRLEREVLKAEGAKNILFWIAVSGWLIALLSLGFTWFTWTTTYDEFCQIRNRFATLACEVKKPTKSGGT